MAKKLKDLTINKVALVPAGANPGAHILLYKAEDEMDVDTFVKATFNEIRSARVAGQVAYRVCDMAYDFIEAAYSAPKDSNPKASLEKSLAQFADAVTNILAEAKDMADTDAALKSAKSATDERAAQHRSEEEEPVKKTTTKKIAEMTREELVEHAEELEKSAAQPNPPGPPAPKPGPTPEPPQPPTPTPPTPTPAPDEFAKRMETVENENKALRERLEKSEEARERGRLAGVAKTAYPHLPGTAEELGNVLYSLEKLPKEEREAVEKLLKSGSEAIGKLMEADGYDEEGEGGSTAVEKLDTIAKQMVKDGKAKTYEQGFDQAATDNPELYQQYRTERRSGRSAH